MVDSHELLEVMEKNSRISIKDLAVMLDENEEGIADQLAQLEREKIIFGYHTMINWDKARVDRVTALIEVRVTPQRGEGFDTIAQNIYRFEEVSAVYLMSGAFDLTVIVEGRTMKEVALFVAQRLAPIDQVLSTSTHFVLKRYKDHGVILEDRESDERMIVSP
ncbi:MAG: Lrp/AsnC family transcriptional regulator [Firmicutes bacterium]|nr:Lrp/AsnC family transcriptional regulator [Bacillota bacterium]